MAAAHPAGPSDIAALAAAPVRRTVVWLDELQRYLDGERGLTGAVMRALLGVPTPAVRAGTLRPELYTRLHHPAGTRQRRSRVREREVLDLAATICIGPAFSPSEQDRPAPPPLATDGCGSR